MSTTIETEFAEMVANLLQDELCPEFRSDLLHGFMGMASEAGELLSKYAEFKRLPDHYGILIELSDLLHFTQMIIGKLGDLTISDVIKLEGMSIWNDDLLDIRISGFDIRVLQGLGSLSGATGELLNRYKKFIFYHGEPLSRMDIVRGLERVMHYMMLVTVDLFGSSIEELMVINLAKLHTRYPKGYSHTNAITHNRDKKKERAAVIAAIEEYRRSR